MKMKKILNFVICAGFVAALATGCPPKPNVKPDNANMGAKDTTPTSKDGMKNYLVRNGDSLWRIAGKNSVMGDSFQWPLLFKSNRDQIEDPDIIEKRQDLSFKENYSRREIREAVGKAYETPPYVSHTKPRRVLPVKY